MPFCFSLSSHLFLHLGNVNEDGRVIFACESGGILQRFLRTGVDRMRRGSGVNQRIALPLLQELLGVGEHRRVRLVVGSREVDEGFAQHAAHAGFLGLFRDGIFEVIHVREGGHAGTDLLSRGETRSPAHKFLGHVLGFGGENVLVEPVVERHVVVQAAEQRHRDVGVAVDEAGQNERVFRVDCSGDLRTSLRVQRVDRRRR